MKTLFTITIIITTLSATLFGQEEKKSSVDPSCDLVSGYIWRGLPSYVILGESDVLLGPNLQPMITFSKGSFKAGAWGSTDFSGKYKETDLFVGYEVGNFTFEVGDYFWVPDWTSADYFEYNSDSTGHIFEGIVKYSFPKIPLILSIGTMFYGADKQYDDPEKNAYSTYLEAAYTMNVSANELTFTAGFSPWDGIYGDSYGGKEGFAVVNLMATAKRNIKITESFEVPVWASLIANPQYNKIFLVFGMSF